MIYLTTGQPGAGKTLWTINYVKQLAEKENRPVYYSGINDLKLPWIEMDNPEQWHKLPKGSIIVIDEAQRLFRPRAVGSQVPEYVQALETHRHQGHDLFIVTQHPMLIESNVRRLIGRHWHVMRAFGTNRAAVHEFNGLKQEPDKSRDGSILHQWKYPQEVFSYYKSAELHTHKRNIPMRFWFLVAAPFIIGGLGYYAYSTLTGISKPQQEQQQQGLFQIGATPAAMPEPVHNKAISTLDYVAEIKPRIKDMPQSAPRYDELNKPVAVPKPASCIVSASKGCRCFTQQATPLDVPDGTCRQIVEYGWFDDTQETIYQTPNKRGIPQAQPVPPAREGGGVSPS